MRTQIGNGTTSGGLLGRPRASVLVVDDNPLNLDLLERRLSKLGFVVTTASGGREAIALVSERPFDIALLDVMMPDVDGLQVLAAIRSRHGLAALPVIMVTAKAHGTDIAEALALGANDYVTKPVDLPVLLARMNTHLEMRRLSQQKDEFLRIASHDLKNPLAEVQGLANFVAASVAPGEPLTLEAHGLLGHIAQAASAMQELVEDFLDFQALADGQLLLREDEIDLGALAREAVAAERLHADRKTIVLGVELSSVAPVVRGDRRRLAQVLRNLVENAVKYSPAGSKVLVRTRSVEGGALFEVVDNGPGLPVDEMSKLFQPYGKLTNKPTGGESSTGHGLAISKRFVEAQGGQIGAFNNPTGGATFWVNLPATATALVAGHDQDMVG